MLYGLLTLVLFVTLMFGQIDPLHELFDVMPSRLEPLWRIR